MCQAANTVQFELERYVAAAGLLAPRTFQPSLLSKMMPRAISSCWVEVSLRRFSGVKVQRSWMHTSTTLHSSAPRGKFQLADSPDFSVHNLPYGVFSIKSTETAAERRIGVALGDYVIDCRALAEAGLLPKCMGDLSLNSLMGKGKPTWDTVRKLLRTFVCDPDSPLNIERLHSEEDKSQKKQMKPSIEEHSLAVLMDKPIHHWAVKRQQVRMHMPCEVGDFSDFFTSPQHASRGHADSLSGNWTSMPIAYHSRTSSLTVADLNGSSVRRPNGQRVVDMQFGPCKWLDYELEVGVFVGGEDAPNATHDEDDLTIAPLSNSLGAAEDRLFGLVLLNDWSARDIQRYEMAPLGPFLGKSFATTISPWVVPMAALDPFRVRGCSKGGPTQDMPQEPVPLHLCYKQNASTRNVEMKVHADIRTENKDSYRICRSNLDCMYWSFAQMLAHHRSNGCPVHAGDLLGSGTLSSWTGPYSRNQPERKLVSWGCLAEQNLYGQISAWFRNADDSKTDAIERVWLEDGDSVVLSGFAEKNGVRVGFGESNSKVLPAVEYKC